MTLQHDPIPAGFFERVAHYESATPPQPSPSTRVLKMKFRNSIAPSPSTSNKSQNSEVATPAALRPHHSGEDMIQSKEDSLRMQELKEEEELKARRKVEIEGAKRERERERKKERERERARAREREHFKVKIAESDCTLHVRGMYILQGVRDAIF